jgi:hypothetical protein
MGRNERSQQIAQQVVPGFLAGDFKNPPSDLRSPICPMSYRNGAVLLSFNEPGVARFRPASMTQRFGSETRNVDRPASLSLRPPIDTRPRWGTEVLRTLNPV